MLAAWLAGWILLTCAGVAAVELATPAAITLASAGILAIGLGGIRPLLILLWHGIDAALAAGKILPLPTAQTPRPRDQRLPP